ncbi:facilitated trehalose transporter Tret1 [Anabrus simplex]|uniref:facilitated trehalose transporter Tret1 n=1 Tax=Anabrus simplex TaxID=316456 RepID=UPI0035A38336
MEQATRRSDIRQYVAAIAANLLSFIFGIFMGWTAMMLPDLLSSDTPLQGGPITKEDVSWLASIMCLSSIPAAPLFSCISEKFGRKPVGYMVGLFYLVTGLMVALSDTVEILYVSRVILGCATSGTFVFTPLYVSEIAEDRTRGPLGTILATMVNIGTLYAFVIGATLRYYTVAWLCVLPSIIFLLVLFWIPETPGHLLRQNRHQEAKQALQWLRGKRADIIPELETTKNIMKKMESSKAASFKDLVTSKGAFRAFYIILALATNQQLCGLTAVTSYTVLIFQESGSNLSPDTSTIVVGLMSLVGSVLASILCSHFRRKTLLLFGNVFLAVSLVALGFYFYFKHLGQDVSSIGWVPVTSLSVYVLVFNLSFSSLPLVITSEIFSPHLLGKALSINGPYTALLAFLVGKFFINLSSAVGTHGSFWIYAVFCVLGSIFIIVVLPETKDCPLQTTLDKLSGTKSKFSAEAERLTYEAVRSSKNSSV